MAKFEIVAGATSQTIELFIQDSSSTTGAGLKSLAYNTGSLTAYYSFPRGASTAITLATLASATAAWSSGGFYEIDSTNKPGHYRFDIPNVVIGSGNGRYVNIALRGAANMAHLVVEIELTGWDNQSTTDGGLSKLTSLTFTVSNKIDANVYTWNGTAVSSPATAGIPEVNVKNINNVAASSVTTVNANVGTTQALTFDSNNLAKVSLVDILNTALTESSAGYLTAGFKKFFNVAAPTSTMNEITLVDTTTAVTNAIVLPSIPSNWITAAGINAAALNGKGDWLISSSYPSHFGSMLITAAGNVGIDWANVANPTSTVALTNTTISTGQTVGTVTGGLTTTTLVDGTYNILEYVEAIGGATAGANPTEGNFKNLDGSKTVVSGTDGTTAPFRSSVTYSFTH